MNEQLDRMVANALDRLAAREDPLVDPLVEEAKFMAAVADRPHRIYKTEKSWSPESSCRQAAFPDAPLAGLFHPSDVFVADAYIPFLDAIHRYAHPAKPRGILICPRCGCAQPERDPNGIRWKRRTYMAVDPGRNYIAFDPGADEGTFTTVLAKAPDLEFLPIADWPANPTWAEVAKRPIRPVACRRGTDDQE